MYKKECYVTQREEGQYRECQEKSIATQTYNMCFIVKDHLILVFLILKSVFKAVGKDGTLLDLVC